MPAEEAWRLEAAELQARLATPASGLSAEEATRRLQQFGPNTVEEHQQQTALRLLAGQFSSPLVLILLAGALLSMFLAQWVDAGMRLMFDGIVG